MQNTLVSWIGHTDLWAMAKDAVPAVTERVTTHTRKSVRLGANEKGPIKSLVEARHFDRIDLISNGPDDLSEDFAHWLGGHPSIHRVHVSDPTSYDEVLPAFNRILEEVFNRLPAREQRCTVNLSSGTPTMHAVFVLLGKTRFPVEFLQAISPADARRLARENTLVSTHIPFDIVECLPDLLRNPDRRLVELATRSPRDIAGFEQIVGESRAIKRACLNAHKFALREVGVLLTGESGTGKELFAEAMHAASPRHAGPFVARNCAAIPGSLFESELFGHEKGAFTDSVQQRKGAFREADGGTLFLDEVGECSLENQAKLLRVLQPRRGDERNLEICKRWIQPVGDDRTHCVNVRIIAATNCNLLQRVQQQAFRDDLYHRLAIVTLQLPPLRERRNDISLLASDRLNLINRLLSASGEPDYHPRTLTVSSLRRLMNHDWPGNIRELQNVLMQAAILSPESTIDRHDIDSALTTSSESRGATLFSQFREPGFRLQERLADIERRFIEDALADADGVKAKAAHLLGLRSPQALDRKLKSLDLNNSSERK